ncbi:prolyl oligopeptidase family serine peptidase [Nannocystis sp. ILAH1]|uniref:prolyl oligopeptidase family serine peptidase n=1 Tax=Nannocystis sp. ILAH1 TaxID=2996789 RepID=UPI00226DFBAC|nr:prolyl oligopeptidase family serine peptidase [Nannocystis sp. ILAH1]MCY0991342.1 prolyl oligopeptidase family serine peptidase [Nannocystis sp. ILAH1]
MLRHVPWGLLGLALAACSPATPVRSPASPAAATPTATAEVAPDPRAAYPQARRGEPADDPYRWLEDDGDELSAWIAAENRHTDGALGSGPARAALRERLAVVHRYESFGVPVRRGGRYFWTYRDGVRDQAVLMTAPALDAAATVVLDPETVSAGGRFTFAGWVVSPDGKYLAYGLAEGGGDWTTWHVRDLATGKDLPETFDHVKYYRPVFTRDGRVFYGRFPAPPKGGEIKALDHGHAVHVHRLGRPTSEDRVVFARPEHPTWQFDLEVTPDGRYLVITIGDGQVGDRGVERIATLDLRAGATAAPRLLVDDFDTELILAGSDGPRLLFMTTADAPNKRVVAIDVRRPERAAWQTVVPAGPHAIHDVVQIGRQLVVTSLVDAHTEAVAYDLRGEKLREIGLPGLGTAYFAAAEPGASEGAAYFTGFTVPGAVYRYDAASGALTAWKRPSTAFDPTQFETEQVFVTSRDGTRVPMFVVGKRGLPRDGTSPAIMTAYGFGGVSSTPYFDASTIPWLERGGRFALVNVRGGGEYGEAWHQAAVREKRQTGIDDFLAAANHLVSAGYTSVSRLGATGVSGGGTLVAAAVVQRPDAFGAVVPVVGVHDLLRFHLFGQGAGWAGDMGSPEVPAEAAVLRKISPLHNVRPGTRYPAMLITTSDHDVRVAPLHSYKLAAALQAAQAGPASVLLRVYTRSGHGASRLSKRLEQAEELFTFFTANLR